MVVNQKQLAKILGISDRQVRKLREVGLFQNVENGRGYSLENCVQEYIEMKSKAEPKKGAIDKEREQAEHERVKKEIAMIKLKHLKGQMHKAADVENFLDDMLANFRSYLLSVPQRIAQKIIGEQDITIMIRILQDEMIQALDELSEYDFEKIAGQEIWEDDEDNDGE